jgi:site-specific DNA-methyltransferase (adenine-specific)/modification methylase
MIGNATLYHGDCHQILPSLGNVDAVIADPPYGINLGKISGTGRNRWNEGTNYGFNIVGDDHDFDPTPWLGFGKVVLFGGNHFGSRLPDASCWLIWDKRDGGTSDSCADCELAWTNLKGPARLFSQKWRGMVRSGEENVSRGAIRLHPAQKPVAMLAWVIEQCKLPAGAVILDPYMGSASLGIAALRGGYRYIGIDIERRWFDVACTRLEQEVSQGQLFTPEQIKQEQLGIFGELA